MWLGVVDSQLLLDVCDGDRVADEVLFMLRVKGYMPTASQTTVQELMVMAMEDKCQLSMMGLRMLSIDPRHDAVFAPEIDRIIYGPACLAADALQESGLVPDKNLGLVISEASALLSKVLIFDDDTLARLNKKAINACLADRQLATVLFQSWTELLQN
jgi:hypothetical protein